MSNKNNSPEQKAAWEANKRLRVHPKFESFIGKEATNRRARLKLKSDKRNHSL